MEHASRQEISAQLEPSALQFFTVIDDLFKTISNHPPALDRWKVWLSKETVIWRCWTRTERDNVTHQLMELKEELREPGANQHDLLVSQSLLTAEQLLRCYSMLCRQQQNSPTVN